jgi:integrase
MKSDREHVVPLSSQVIELLRELSLCTHNSADALLFPSASDKSKPISDATLSKALRTMGYAGRQVPHGFRHTASTLLSAQQKFSPDAIEMQLSHGHKDRIRGVYNKWEYLPERAQMMQFWGDYLQTLKIRRPTPAG